MPICNFYKDNKDLKIYGDEDHFSNIGNVNYTVTFTDVFIRLRSRIRKS